MQIRTARTVTPCAELEHAGAGATKPPRSSRWIATRISSRFAGLAAGTALATVPMCGLLTPTASHNGSAVASVPGVNVPIGPTDNAQLVVSSHAAGSSFVIEAGDHVGFSVQPKADDTFVGQPGAVLDGGGLVANAFYAGGSLPADVTIEGASPAARMVVRSYSDGGLEQQGTIQPIVSTNRQANHWVLQSLEVTGSYSRGITTSSNMVVTDCLIDHNGRLGIGGPGSNVNVSNNEISFNDTRGVAPGFERGGAKFGGTSGLVFEGNDVHDNAGPGVWTDVDAVYSTISSNTVENNLNAGIFAEISHYTVIAGNTVIGNGFGSPNGPASGGIVLSTSDNAQVYWNVLSGDANGIDGISGDRGSGPYGVRVLANDSVQGNDVSSSGKTGVGGSIPVAPGSVVYSSDHYIGEGFKWVGQGDLTWAEWQALPEDSTGAWIL